MLNFYYISLLYIIYILFSFTHFKLQILVCFIWLTQSAYTNSLFSLDIFFPYCWFFVLLFCYLSLSSAGKYFSSRIVSYRYEYMTCVWIFVLLAVCFFFFGRATWNIKNKSLHMLSHDKFWILACFLYTVDFFFNEIIFFKV